MRFTAQFSHSSHVSIRDLIKPADSSKRRVLQVKFVSMAEHAKHSFLEYRIVPSVRRMLLRIMHTQCYNGKLRLNRSKVEEGDDCHH